VRRGQRTGQWRPAAGVWALAAAVLLAAGATCGDDSGPSGPPPDVDPPEITIVFPTDGEHDRDGDGLVDIEVVFADSGRGIDPATIRVTSDRSLKGGPGAGEDLLPAWTVTRADSMRLVLEETVEHLLPRGSGTLTVSATDGAGNGSEVAIDLDLQPAALHKVIDLRASQIASTSRVVVSPDVRRAYVTTEELTGSAISVVDLERLAWAKTERTPLRGLSQIALDEGRGRLYVMSIDFPRMAVFDLGAERFMAEANPSRRGIGIAYSATRDEIYIGLEVEDSPDESTAWIQVMDAATLERKTVWVLDYENVSNKGKMRGMSALVLNPFESRLYVTTSDFAQDGILVVDPERGKLVELFDLQPEREAFRGGAQDAEWIDGGFLSITARVFGMGRIAVVPIDNPHAIRFGDIGMGLLPRALGVAPDGSAWAVTVADVGAGHHEILLMNPTTLDVLWRDPIPREQSVPAGVTFRPDGHVFFFTGSTRGDSFANPPQPTELLVYLFR